MAEPAAAAPNRRHASVTNTAAVSFGTAGGAEVIIWLFDCWKAHAMIVPDQNVALMLAALFAPFVHTIGRAILSWLNRGILDSQPEQGFSP